MAKMRKKLIGTRLVLDGNLFFNLTSVPFPAESFEEVSDSTVLLGIASQGQVRVDAILNTPAFSFLGNIAVGFKVIDDVAGSFFRDTDRRGDFPGGDAGVLGDKA